MGLVMSYFEGGVIKKLVNTARNAYIKQCINSHIVFKWIYYKGVYYIKIDK